jgi:4-amino-4-deoxy-L-arabinose transferase-like glycosyltransferase
LIAPAQQKLSSRAGTRLGLVAVIATVLLIRLPFLNQAIQGDDVYYLAGAQHAQINPLHPSHATYAFLGQMVDMRGFSHPPLNSWFLGALLALFGDIEEARYHAAYLSFSLIAAVAMWSLARRFSPHPLAATLLFVAVPVFVVNGNSLESDLPLLAFWMAGTAFFVSAVDSRSPWRLAAAGIALVLAALAAYQSVFLVPVLGLYLWLNAGRWSPGWAVALIPGITLAAWQYWERASTGALPASVLAGYFQSHGFQALGRKIGNAAALTVHAGWIVFPALAAAAFLPKLGRAAWVALAFAAMAAAALDPNPLFWLCFAIGLAAVAFCARLLRPEKDPDAIFLAGWFLVFFAGALVVFFAGSARYLLPAAAPLILLVCRSLAGRPHWLLAGAAAQLLLGLALSAVNYEHWDGYRQFARSLAGQTAEKRVWINSELGLRYYLEADGGLPLLQSQAVRPGDVVVSSRLAFPLPFTTGGGVLAPLAEREIRSRLPLRLIALGSRSAYSATLLGFRPFDVARGPIDVVRADTVLERKPTREYLPMDAPEAAQQIVSGIHQLEANWRWMGERGVLLLKRPGGPAQVEAVFFIPDQAPARRVSLLVDGVVAAEHLYASPGSYTLQSAKPVTVSGESATVTITVDKTFTAPGDHRSLGLILSGVGFR